MLRVFALRIVKKPCGAGEVAGRGLLAAGTGAAAEQKQGGEVLLRGSHGNTGDGETFAAGPVEDLRALRHGDLRPLLEKGLEERDLALAQGFDEKGHVDRPFGRHGAGQFAGRLLQVLALAVPLQPFGDHVFDGVFQGVVQVCRVNIVGLHDLVAQTGGDDPVELGGELAGQVVAADQRLLVAVDMLGLLGEIGQCRLGNARAGILQQRGNDVAVLCADQFVADHFADVAPPGDGDLVLPAAVLDDPDQLLVRQQRGAQQHRLSHRELVVGQGHHQGARRCGVARQALGQALADRCFEFMDQLVENIEDQVAFLIAQHMLALKGQLGDLRRQLLTTLDGLVHRQLQQGMKILILIVHSVLPHKGRPT